LLDEILTLDEAERLIEEGVKCRQERFLSKLKRTVFGNPRSPYRRLLAAAGCEFGDVQRLVAAEGVEGALSVLARSGVYVSYEEFKCREPVVRGSQRFHFREQDFNDPLRTEHFSSTTGGSRGGPVRVPIDIDHITEMAPPWAVFLAEHHCFDAPLVRWMPAHAGEAACHLSWAKCNQKYVHWFAAERMRAAKDRLYAACVHSLTRRVAGLPRHEYVPFSHPEPVLESVLALRAEGKRPCVNTAPSAAAKLSLLARNRGDDLSGVTFLLGAEPLTPARRRTIEASGATAAPLYGSSEAPWIGGQCRCPGQSDEVHVLLDGYAVIPALAAGDDDDDGHSLLLTSLRSASPKVLLNTDIGDRAVLRTRRCDCLYDRLGCWLTLNTIRSSDKVTEFGVTFAVSDIMHVLEEVFPRRFGGAAGHYQLVETRDAQGLAHYTLLVDAGLPGINEQELPAAFFSEISKLRDYYRFMAAVWAREELVGVRRGSPLASPRGKVLTFHRVFEDPC
jgi:hypothetical protein